jgi:DNA repair protein SbcD/Mre11
VFKFIHAADLHLDSPLRGLSARSQDAASRVQTASREALESMIDLAISEQCEFIVIAGDLFDGQWKDFRTGLYFASQMARLKAAKIQVVIIQGNHDAENSFVARLELSENVKLLSSKRPETFLLEPIKVAIHGQSFATREVTENIALRYPSPVPGCLNIGVLHTALEGHAGQHATYAPCTVDQLKNHGYDYWALGHVHDFMLLHDTSNPADPHIVYSGVIQGRNIRETGQKGVVLVTVEDGQIQNAEFRPLGTVAWHSIHVSVDGINSVNALLQAATSAVEGAYQSANRTACAVRVRLCGSSSLRSRLLTERDDFKQQLETAMAGLSENGDIWLEKLELNLTEASETQDIADVDDPSIAGSIASMVRLEAEGDLFASVFGAMLEELKPKFPVLPTEPNFLEQLIEDTRVAAKDLALAILETSQNVSQEVE